MSAHSTVRSYPYKTTPGGYDLSMDVYLPDETKFGVVAALAHQLARGNSLEDVSHALPVLLFFHGGGLVSGNRAKNAWFPHWLLKDALDAGFCFISADYTLLSPQNGHSLVEDARDCVAFIATTLNDKLGLTTSHLTDPARIVVAGCSAGGWMASMCAHHATPKPTAILAIYSLGCKYILDSYVAPTTEPISDFPYLPSTPYLPLLNSPSTSLRTLSTSIDATTDPRVSYPFWLLQGGLFLDVLTGQTGLSASLALLEPSQRAAALPDDARPLFPHLAVDESWPPTYFIHGTADTAVPVSESREMAKLLDSKGVPYDLVEVEGAGHAFDKVAESREIAGLEGAVPFLLKYAPQAKQ